MKITDHIARETALFNDCLKRYAEELELFDSLSTLYDRLIAECPIRTATDRPASGLFLVVSIQMLGIPSQVLRGRVTDAYVLARRAIEGTGAARVLAEQPELERVFISAYPNVGDADHPQQFLPSREYKQAFSTRKLFKDATDDPWRQLRVMYATISATHSQAGIGAMISHQLRDGRLFMPAVESDDRVLLRSWYSLLATFTSILEAFFLIFVDLGHKIGDDFRRAAVTLRDEMRHTLQVRAPWFALPGGP